MSDSGGKSRSLIESRRLYALAEEVAEIGHWQLRVDVDPPELAWSDQTYRIHGRDPTNFTPMVENAIEAYHPDDRDEVRQHIERAISEKTAFDFSLRIVRPDGEIRYVQSHGRVEVDGDGNVVALFGVIQDKTRDVFARRAVQDAEMRFRSLIENTRYIMFFTGEKGDGPHGYGEKGVQAFGRDADDISGVVRDGRSDLDLWYSCVHPDDRERYIEAERGRKEEGKDYILDYRFFHPQTGEERWVRESAWVVRTESGRVFFDSHLIDITRERRINQQLAEAKEEAELASRAKSEFLTRMSHEFRTPLNAILGFSEILSAGLFGPLGDQRYLGYARDIHQSGQLLLSLINDLLDLSRVESGRYELFEENVDIVEALETVVRQMRQTYAGKRQDLSFTRPATDLGLLCDRRAFVQMVTNLLANACKFTPAGGGIEVSVVVTASALEVVVSDEGVGIAEEDIDLVLSPFGQASQSSATEPTEGSGLGLAIVRSLIELHDGTVRIDSTVGVGTAVTLSFPIGRIVASTAANDQRASRSR